MPKSKSAIDQIKQLELNLKQATELHKRALADYQNLEKRFTQEKAQYLKLANADIIHKFIQAIDHLEQAAHHLKDPGLDMVLEEFHHLLDSEGVTPVRAQDQPFDPDTMECTEQVAGPINQVVSVSQAGYLLDGHLIRPAKVTVGNGKKI